MTRKSATPPVDTTLRCAIYTRKSTEEGLDQDFNSLDAQREAAEAYIQSQRGEGWEVVPKRYDDGGFTGANMDRPALRQLLADIEAGRVNAVVVYKVDRLSRSLLDFARIMEILDRLKVAFVSVTQQFSTATSMGRLVLHILLSFAQFEREMIAERTRDKMCAARRKGKWVGGMPVLGYDVAPGGGKLLVNEEEAAQIREIFDVYLREQSLTSAVADLNTRGWTTKSWITKSGRLHPGTPFDRARLHRLLSNVIYTGQVSHKGEIYPGEHPEIVGPDVWRQVQSVLRYNGRTGGKAVRNKHGALLKDLLRCVPCDSPMGHSFSVKGKKRYRYYVCSRAQKEGWAACPTKSLPAQEVERFVIDRIRAIGEDPAVVAGTIAQALEQHAAELRRLENDRRKTEKDLRAFNTELRRLLETPGKNGATTDRLADLQDRIQQDEKGLAEIRAKVIAASREVVDEEDLAAALSHFDPVWDALFPREQARILRLSVEQVGYDGEKGTLALTFRPTGIRALAGEAGVAGEEGALMSSQAPTETKSGGWTFQTEVHFRHGARGRKQLRVGEAPEPASVVPGRVPRVARLLALAHRFEALVQAGDVRDYADLARLSGVTRARVTQIMNLLHLGPDIQEAILHLPRTLEGRDRITERHLRRIVALPEWTNQRAVWKAIRGR